MVICARCGTENPPDAKFCNNCDAFLEWEGAAETSKPVQEKPVPEKEATEKPVAQKSVNGQQAAASVPAAVPEPAPVPEAPRQRPLPQPEPAPRAAQPSVGQSSVAQPTEEQPRRPPRPAPPEPPPQEPPVPGDKICGQCGAGNVPTRNFCHSCGASLADVRVVAEPWWRRFLPKPGGKRYEAGSRPGKGGIRRRGGQLGAAGRRMASLVRRVLLVAVLLLGLLYALIPGFRSAVNDQVLALKDAIQGIFVTKLDPVHPIDVQANHELPGHQPNMASDGYKNTYWAADAGANPTLVFTFQRQVDIREAIVHSGVGADLESTARPRTLHLVYSTGKTYDVKLADTGDEQQVDIKNSAGARRVEIHVGDLYRSLQSDDVAISEIELFQPAQR